VSAAVPESDVPARGDVEACAALGDDLGWALGVLARTYRDVAKEAFGDLPGGARGYQVLRYAAGEAPATQLALAQQLGIDRTVMTYLLDDLERAGVAERRPDPADRRARRVAATAEGRARLAKLDARLREAEDVVLQPLSGEEAAAFRGMLQRLATQVDDGTAAEACNEAAADLDAGRGAAPSGRSRRAR
jgi:DNA-binding MarR family transcriptional regulator